MSTTTLLIVIVVLLSVVWRQASTAAGVGIKSIRGGGFGRRPFCEGKALVDPLTNRERQLSEPSC